MESELNYDGPEEKKSLSLKEKTYSNQIKGIKRKPRGQTTPVLVSATPD